MFVAACTTAKANSFYAWPVLDNLVFRGGAPFVHELASCEFDDLIQALIPLCTTLIPPGAVTSPAPRDPMDDPRAALPQCQHDNPRKDRDDEIAHLGQPE